MMGSTGKVWSVNCSIMNSSMVHDGIEEARGDHEADEKFLPVRGSDARSRTGRGREREEEEREKKRKGEMQGKRQNTHTTSCSMHP